MADARIKIMLPVPLDISGSLMEALGARYPGTSIITDVENPEFLVFNIPDDDRMDPSEFDWDPTSEFLGFSPDGSMSVRTPHEFTLMLLDSVRSILDETESPNYVEMTAYAGLEKYTITLGRPGGKTPHELRLVAEERAAIAERKLSEVQSELTELQAEIRNMQK